MVLLPSWLDDRAGSEDWMRMSRCLSACVGAALSFGSAEAFVLDGAVTASSAGGAFQKLDPADAFAVGDDTFQDPNLYAFDEDQNIEVPAAIEVDIGETIPAGAIVASHYVFFDPSFGEWQTGYVDFDAPILGVAASVWTLEATDFLANTSVRYLSPTLRGLEWEDEVWIDPDNPQRLWVRWVASTPGDYIRVFTGPSPGV